jgi:hypothetical protein
MSGFEKLSEAALRNRNLYRRMTGQRPFTEAEWAAIDAAEEVAKVVAQQAAELREDWQENTTKGWHEWFAVSEHSITNWAQDRDWVRKVKAGRYAVNVAHPEARAKRMEAEKNNRK